MDIKQRPNHQLYLRTLAKMTPEQRLMKAFELSVLTKQLFIHGLQKRFPKKSEDEIKELYLQRLTKCYNQKF